MRTKPTLLSSLKNILLFDYLYSFPSQLYHDFICNFQFFHYFQIFFYICTNIFLQITEFPRKLLSNDRSSNFAINCKLRIFDLVILIGTSFFLVQSKINRTSPLCFRLSKIAIGDARCAIILWATSENISLFDATGSSS